MVSERWVECSLGTRTSENPELEDPGICPLLLHIAQTENTCKGLIRDSRFRFLDNPLMFNHTCHSNRGRVYEEDTRKPRFSRWTEGTVMHFVCTCHLCIWCWSLSLCSCCIHREDSIKNRFPYIDRYHRGHVDQDQSSKRLRSSIGSQIWRKDSMDSLLRNWRTVHSDTWRGSAQGKLECSTITLSSQHYLGTHLRK